MEPVLAQLGDLRRSVLMLAVAVFFCELAVACILIILWRSGLLGGADG